LNFFVAAMQTAFGRIKSAHRGSHARRHQLSQNFLPPPKAATGWASKLSARPLRGSLRLRGSRSPLSTLRSRLAKAAMRSTDARCCA
jgi:hypothetical protein